MNIVQAVLKALHSPSIFDLPNYRPENENSFAFLLQAIIGPKDDKSKECFDIEVCTPL
ncbi:Imm8 family immunity protein [Bartonella sp. HY328]|uniref:Imm8 family immunity protein n=1 Tax=unclassified Bartonella TaxID=2645622 RepID=UPI003965AEEA